MASLYIAATDGEALIDRDAFVSELKRRGIGISVHFIPLHLHPFYQKKFGYKPGDFPRRKLNISTPSLYPSFPTMSGVEVEAVITAVSEVAQAFSRKS